MTGRVTWRPWVLVGWGSVVFLLGCSGLFGSEDEVPPTVLAPVPAPPVVPVPPVVPTTPGELPSTAGWDQHRLQQARMAIHAPDGWTVTDSGGVITADAPGGASVRIAPSETCTADRAAKKSEGVDVVLDPDLEPWVLELNGTPRGRLEALSAQAPDRFEAAHIAACCRPLRTLAAKFG